MGISAIRLSGASPVGGTTTATGTTPASMGGAARPRVPATAIARA
ncbi:hypothetical protein [Streptomyces sp. NPDC005322]